jgi:pyruvate/2-oxoglutarate dehydrogenase complex dihydrolipoamide acyltransferase (E2) component
MPRRWQQAYASPLAKRLAAERGVDLSQMIGSGPNGRIVRADLQVMAPVSEPESATFAIAADAVYSIALDVVADGIQAVRAARWEAGERPALGALVAEAARQALRGQDGVLRNLSVHEGESGGAAPGLAVLDLAAFGMTAFTPPPLAGTRATLGVSDIRREAMLATRPQGGVSIESASLLRLTLTADHRDLPFPVAARLLAAVRDVLETEPAD